MGGNIAALFPKSNIPGDPVTHANNFFALGSSETVSDHIGARVDWAHNEMHSMYFRWSERLRNKNPQPDFFGTGATPTQEEADTGFHGVLGNTFTPDPTTVINVLIASGRWNENHTPIAPGKVTPTTLGLNPADFQGQFAPPFSIDGYTSLGYGAIQDYIRNVNTLQVDVSKQKGAHAVKFGAYLESDLINFINEYSGPQPYAPYSFSRSSTGGAMAAPPARTRATASPRC